MPEKVFFTSCARLDNDDQSLSDVVKEILSRVKKKFGEEVETLFDTEDLENGQQWQQRLGESLRELRVIVCMCSPAYLKSAFCAKEFAVFRQRYQEAMSMEAFSLWFGSRRRSRRRSAGCIRHTTRACRRTMPWWDCGSTFS